MPAEESSGDLPRDDQRTLLEMARRAIALRAAGETPVQIPLAELAPGLRHHRATFVTLRVAGKLRGCCGSLQAFEPLAWNVIRSAQTAGFGDRRFPPLLPDEVPGLDLHISILSATVAVECFTEADLLEQLQPGTDGLILSEPDPRRQAVFLPAVWKQLPEPQSFVRRLKQKGGWDADYWSPGMKAYRFSVQSIGQDAG